jgi:hypothetical protein
MKLDLISTHQAIMVIRLWTHLQVYAFQNQEEKNVSFLVLISHEKIEKTEIIVGPFNTSKYKEFVQSIINSNIVKSGDVVICDNVPFQNHQMWLNYSLRLVLNMFFCFCHILLNLTHRRGFFNAEIQLSPHTTTG